MILFSTLVLYLYSSMSKKISVEEPLREDGHLSCAKAHDKLYAMCIWSFAVCNTPLPENGRLLTVLLGPTGTKQAAQKSPRSSPGPSGTHYSLPKPYLFSFAHCCRRHSVIRPAPAATSA